MQKITFRPLKFLVIANGAIHIYSGGPNNTWGSFFDATRDPTFLGVSLFMEAIEVASIEDLMGSQ